VKGGSRDGGEDALGVRGWPFFSPQAAREKIVRALERRTGDKGLSGGGKWEYPWLKLQRFSWKNAKPGTLQSEDHGFEAGFV